MIHSYTPKLNLHARRLLSIMWLAFASIVFETESYPKNTRTNTYKGATLQYFTNSPESSASIRGSLHSTSVHPKQLLYYIYIYITCIHGIHRSVHGIHVSAHPSFHSSICQPSLIHPTRSMNFLELPKKRLKKAYTSKEPLTGTLVSLGLVNELDECKSSGGSIWQSFDVDALYLQR